MSASQMTRRQRQREATRMEILSAARQLFTDRGYGATSMASIAESAGTAVQTIYDSIGSKAAVLAALIELIEQPVVEAWKQLETTVEARDVLALAVRFTRIINEQSGDILSVVTSASMTEPFAAIALREGKRHHIAGTRRWIEMMANQGSLKSGVTLEYAATTLGVMTNWAVWKDLTIDFELTFDEAEEWITDSLSKLLLEGDGA